MRTQPFRTAAGSSAEGPWRILASGAATGGAVVIGEARLPPHTAGPSLHVHSREDESVYVVSGVLTAAVGDEIMELSAGDFASLSGPPDEAAIDEIGARYGVRRTGPPLDVGP